MIRIFNIAVLVLASLASWGQNGMLLAVPADGVDESIVTDTDSLFCWLKSDVGITEGAGGVATWADQSGNSNDFTAAEAVRPQYANDTLNGYVSVNFEANDRMDASFTDVESVKDSTDATIFVVFTLSTDVNAVLYDNSLILGGRAGIIPYFSGTTYFDWGDTAPSGRLSVSGLSFSDDIFVFTRQGGNMEIRQNGTSVASKADATALIESNVSMALGDTGATASGMVAAVYEIIIYRRGLTGTEISDIESYLNNKYSIY